LAIPVLLYVTSASQGLPVVAAVLAGGRRPPVPHLRLALWSTLLVLSDSIGVVVGMLQGNNLWISYLVMPLEACGTFWILEAWQPDERMRRVYRRAIPVTAVLSVLLLVVTNRAVAFEQWIAPALAIVSLVAVVHTLVHRSLRCEQLLTSQDWFWICLGLALFWLMYAPMPPFADALLRSNIEWVRVAYLARAWAIIAAFVLMFWGMLCPRVLARSYMPS